MESSPAVFLSQDEAIDLNSKNVTLKVTQPESERADWPRTLFLLVTASCLCEW